MTPTQRVALPPPVDVAGVAVHPVTLTETLAYIEGSVREARRETLYYVNAHGCNLAADDERFRRALNAGSLVFCDGKAVQWAASLLGHPLPERFSPPDWVGDLAAMCAREGWPMAFLGGEPGVAEAAARVLRERNPALLVHAEHGYFDRGGEENAAVVARINASGARVLLLGLGMPIQEFWVEENRAALEASVVMTVGAMFDYVAGRVYRAPAWAGQAGLEWLFRLLVEPRRLWRRYLLGNPKFVANVARQRLRGRSP